jgi:hypothetical protein
MVPYACQYGRVQHLAHEGGNAAHHHRGDIAAHSPSYGIGAKQTVGPALDRLFPGRSVVEKVADLSRE